MTSAGSQLALEVDVDALEKTANDLEQHLLAITQYLKEMREEVETLEGTWAGANHDKFVEDFAACREAIKVHGRALESFTEALKEAAGFYREMEEAVTQSAQDAVNRAAAYG